MSEEAQYCDPEIAQFYDLDNPWPTDYDHFLNWAAPYKCVLDLGCGSGIFSLALFQRGHKVTGVDPARAMIDIAKMKDEQGDVDWIVDDARTFRTDRKYDMVLMTGHAFSALLTMEDRLQTLKTIAYHLKPGGRFFFDSRNPLHRAWETWTKEQRSKTLFHPKYGRVESWTEATYDDTLQIVTYKTCYELIEQDRTLSSISKIAFPDFEELNELLREAGLQTERWIGSPEGEPFTKQSPEIIPFGRLNRSFV